MANVQAEARRVAEEQRRREEEARLAREAARAEAAAKRFTAQQENPDWNAAANEYANTPPPQTYRPPVGNTNPESLYNTPLWPDVAPLEHTWNTQNEQAFQDWKTQNAPYDSGLDYNLRDAYLSSLTTNDNGHLPDTWKKPNHPTFSNESAYSGLGGPVGGQWSVDADGNDVFYASPANLKDRTPQELQDYFSQYEPGVKLVLPGESPVVPVVDNNIPPPQAYRPPVQEDPWGKAATEFASWNAPQTPAWDTPRVASMRQGAASTAQEWPKDQWGNPIINGETIYPSDPRINPHTAREAQYGSAMGNINPISYGLESQLGQYPGGKFASGLIGGAATAVPILGSALAGASGGNTNTSDPAFWNEAAQAVAAPMLTKTGPITEGLAASMGGGAAARIAAQAGFGGASMGALEGANQALTGQFDPKRLAMQTATGAAIAGGATGLTEFAKSTAFREGERGSLDLTPKPKEQAIAREEPVAPVTRMQQTIDETENTLSRPGTIGEMVGKIPGVKKTAGVVAPSVGMERQPLVAYVAKARATADVTTVFDGTRVPQVQELRAAFGDMEKGADGFVRPKVEPQYHGPEGRVIKGTVLDIFENPQDYVITPEQRALMDSWGSRGTGQVGFLNTEYGADIGTYQPKNPGAVYMPHINANEDLMTRMDRTEQSLARGAVGHERTWDTARDRMAHDPKFIPETDPVKLLEAHDSALASAAGKATFKAAAGGKTKLEVMQETHPGLAKQMVGLRQKAASLRATAARLDQRVTAAVDSFLKSGAEDADLAILRDNLDVKVGANAVGVQGVNYGKDLAQMRREITGVKAELKRLGPAWKNANTEPYTLNRSTFKYHTPEQSRTIDELMKTSDNKILNAMEVARVTAFGGDFSPITFIQGQLQAFRAPDVYAKAWAHIISKGGVHLDEIARNEADDVALYSRARGRALGSLSEEFGGQKSLLGHIPKFGEKYQKWNRDMQNVVNYIDYMTWKRGMKIAEWGAPPGTPKEVLAHEVVNAVSKTNPGLNSAERGVSQARAAVERAPLTSMSYLASPALVAKDAVSGMAKLVAHGGDWRALRGREQLAIIWSLQMAGGIAAVSVASAAASAHSRGLSIEENVKRTMNINRREFMGLQVMDKGIVPLGGPFRTFIRGVVPRVNVKTGDVTAPPLASFMRSKLAPTAATAVDVLQNADFRGRKIWSGSDSTMEKILKGAEYIVENTVLPLAASAIVEGQRTGQSWERTIEDSIGQLMGGNVNQPSQWEQYNQQIRKDTGKEWKDLNPFEQWQWEQKHGAPPFSTDAGTKAKQQQGIIDKQTATGHLEELGKQLDAGKMTPLQYRNERDTTLAFLAGQNDVRWATLDAKGHDTAETRYFDLINTSRPANDPLGQPNWEQVNAAFAGWSAEDRAFVESRGLIPKATKKEQEFSDDKQAIVDSGYWEIGKAPPDERTPWEVAAGAKAPTAPDVGTRTQFLIDHRDVLDLVKKWGYSPNVTAFIGEYDRVTERQKNLDAGLNSAAISKKTWLDGYHENVQALASANETLYGDSPANPALAGTPLGRYYEQIKTNLDPATGKPNWRKVDEWLATLPQSEQDAIDNRKTTRIETPRVQAYRDAVKRISDSGYWEMNDKLAARFVRRFGLPVGTTADQMTQAVFKQERDRLMARGMSQAEAELRANIIADRKLRPFTTLAQQQSQKFRRSRKNREIAALLAEYGFWDPGIADTGMIARAVA